MRDCKYCDATKEYEDSLRIAVGDIVTWRHGKSKAKGCTPLGICGCKVLALGEAEDGQPAARLKLPEFFAGLNANACNGYVADLEVE